MTDVGLQVSTFIEALEVERRSFLKGIFLHAMSTLELRSVEN